MQTMMRQAQQMQERLQEEIGQIRVEATAGGGMVTIKMDGHKNVLGVKIDPEVAGDVEMLQDMVLAACNEAVKKVDTETKQKMSGMLGGLGLPPIQALSRGWAEIGATLRVLYSARQPGGC
jgi:DNA-binding YbaB/EbfC family protein